MPKSNLENIPVEIEKAFEKIGISGRGSKAKIAEICGVTPAAVGTWLRSHDRKLPSIDILIQISNVTKTSLDQLVKGEEAINSIPVLLLEDLATYLSADTSPSIKPLFDILDCGNKYIAVIAADDSMTQLGTSRYYPKGAILVFRVETRRPVHEDLVLAKITIKNQDFFVFRQYLENAGKIYFSAFNPVYENITDFDSYEIIGYFSYQIIK